MRAALWLLGAWLILVAVAGVDPARADIGPPDPARKACMGLREGAACTFDGKPGTCQGPHPSRMSCIVSAPDPSGSAGARAEPAGGARSGQGGTPAQPQP